MNFNRNLVIKKYIAIMAILCTLGVLQATPKDPYFQKRLQQKFVRAVIAGNSTYIAKAVQARFDINAPLQGRLDFLSMAIVHFQQPIVIQLITAGADIHGQANPFGITPLIAAARAGNAQATTDLLSRGVCTGPRASCASKALIAATRTPPRQSFADQMTVIQLLLQAGADPNYSDENGKTALEFVTQQGKTTLIQLLQQHGAVPVAHAQVSQHRAKLIQQLGDAITTGNTIMIAYAIGAGAPVNAEYNGQTALSCAMAHFNQPLVQLLVDNGADIHRANVFAFTPFMLAALFGNTEATRLFLQLDADVDQRTLRGETPLILATHHFKPDHSMTDRIGTSKLLLKAGAQVDHTDNYGNSALTEAARWKNVELVKLFLRCGAEAPSEEEAIELGLDSELQQLIATHSHLAREHAARIETMLAEAHPELGPDIPALIRSFETTATPVFAQSSLDKASSSLDGNANLIASLIGDALSITLG